MERMVLPGRPHPLGANWDGTGVNFALYSENATGVSSACMTTGAPRVRTHSGRGTNRLRLARLHSWTSGRPTLWISGLWAFWDPGAGLRFNPAKLLVDPYAQAVIGQTTGPSPIFGYRFGGDDADLHSTSATALPACQMRRCESLLRLGAGPSPAHAALRFRSSTRHTCAASAFRIPTFPSPCGAPMRGSLLPPPEYLKRLGLQRLS